MRAPGTLMHRTPTYHFHQLDEHGVRGAAVRWWAGITLPTAGVHAGPYAHLGGEADRAALPNSAAASREGPPAVRPAPRPTGDSSVCIADKSSSRKRAKSQ